MHRRATAAPGHAPEQEDQWRARQTQHGEDAEDFDEGQQHGLPDQHAVDRRIRPLLAERPPHHLEPLAELDAPDLDHAVARGAAYYGKARRGRGVRIRSGAPRTYYIGIESAMPAVPGLPAPLKALCVVPFGMEEGTEAKIAGREFGLVVGEPAEFRFLSSSLRKQDQIGELIEN